MKTILIDGRPFQVLNALSSGPGCAPHTYITREGIVEKFGTWFFQRRGQFPIGISQPVEKA